MLDNEIRTRLGLQAAPQIDNDYRVWLDCYRGEPYWLNDIGNPTDKKSLNLCAGIASELARLVTIEFESHVSDEVLDEIYQRLLRHIRKIVEYALALGGIMIKPYVADEDKGIIDVDIVPCDMYVILGFTSFGEANHVVFLDRIKKLDKRDKEIFYTRVEEHDLRDGYVIKNRAFMSKNINALGDEIPLNTVPEWDDMAEECEMDCDMPLFSYFKNPQANNLDLRSYEGISCFARAISLIQDADSQYQRILWEYEGSELAIDADVTTIKRTGELPHGKERLFRNLGADSTDGFYSVFSPAIRDASLFNGLNKIIEKIEFLCGLAYGTLSEINESEKTATEIKMSKQRSYSTVVDIQNELKRSLTQFIDICKFWCDELGIKTVDDYEMSFDFDDSLIVDSESEQKIRLQEVAAGILSPEAYLKWRYGIEDDGIPELMPNAGEPDKADVVEEE